MSRPLTDRDRILQLEAANAELRAEVEAWRANANDQGLAEVAWEREETARRFLGHGGQAAVLLCLLIDSPGRILSPETILSAVGWKGDEYGNPRNQASVRVLQLRRALAAVGWPDAVQNAWRRGYYITASTAADLSLAVFGATEAGR
jgi:DNA-binding response OmpR family regulator